MKICGYAPSPHLYTKEEAGRAANPFAAALRRDGELYITILWRSSIHLHIIRTEPNTSAFQLLRPFNTKHLHNVRFKRVITNFNTTNLDYKLKRSIFATLLYAKNAIILV